MSGLSERAVLIKFTAGLPSQSRKDKRTTAEVKSSKQLGENSGKWIAELYPKGALDAIKSKQNEARSYHNKVTFPFGVPEEDDSAGESDKSGPAPIAGIGILAAALYPEYMEKMRQFAGEVEKLAQDFTADPDKWIRWAQAEHNGTFEPRNYPGCTRDAAGVVTVDADKFRSVMLKRIKVTAEPLPVPEASHFSAAVSALLGVDADSVSVRVRDSGIEAQRELLARMKDPVLHMASKLAGQVCHCRACKGKPSKTANFKDSLVENIREIVSLVPKQNMSGDPEIDGFAVEMEKLTRYAPDTLRDDEATRKEAAEKASEVLARLSAYKL